MPMRRLLIVILPMLLPGVAFADAFSVLQVQGTFENGETLSGTLTLDTTTSMFTASTLGIYEPGYGLTGSYLVPTGQGFYSDGTFGLLWMNYLNQHENIESSELHLKLPTIPSAGQTLQFCSISTACTVPIYVGDYESYLVTVYGNFGQYRSNSGLAMGQISPLAAATVTPEPSSFLLLSTGLMAMGAAARRRFCR